VYERDALDGSEEDAVLGLGDAVQPVATLVGQEQSHDFVDVVLLTLEHYDVGLMGRDGDESKGCCGGAPREKCDGGPAAQRGCE